MLAELGAVEQRYRAVLEVLEDGMSVTGVAREYEVARQAVHAWLRRYAGGGMGALAGKSARPGSCPHQMAAAAGARIVRMRREDPGWGPSRLRWELERAGWCRWRAGRRCTGRWCGMARRRREDYRRWERPRAMELWQMEVMGRAHLGGAAEVKIVTGIGDHSRFVVCARAIMRAMARPVCRALARALRRYGIPEQILTGNGKVLTGRPGKGPGPVLSDRICRDNGIRPLLARPYWSAATGKAERLHKSIRAGFFKDAAAGTRGWRSCRRRWMGRWRITTRPGRTSGPAAARRPGGSAWLTGPSSPMTAPWYPRLRQRRLPVRGQPAARRESPGG